MITVSACYVKSEPYESYPNGQLTADGTVNFFTNQTTIGKNNPVKVSNIMVCNQSGMAFYGRESELTTSCLRAIAKSLLDIADKAEIAQSMLLEVNSAKTPESK